MSDLKEWLPWLLTFFGFVAAALGGYFQIKSQVLRQAAEGWEKLAEERLEELKDREREEKEYRVEVEAKFKDLRQEIEALKADGAAKSAENQFLRTQNIQLQISLVALQEVHDCSVADLKRARDEAAVRLAELTAMELERNRHQHRADELTRRLHAQGEETRLSP